MRTGLNAIGLKNSFSKRVQLEPDMLPIISDSATNLVAWYDFSDGTTMFENAAGSDPAEDGDRIQNVTNKAWDGLGSSSVSLNKYIGQPSLTSTDQPVWTKSVGLAPGYLTFTGSEELYSSILIGNVSTGKMGGVTVNQENHTISFVLKNGSLAETTDHMYFGYQNSGRRVASIGLESTDDQMHYWPEYSASDIDSNAAYSGNIESWTIVMGQASTSGANVRQIKIYKNGVLVDTDTTDFSSKNKDLTANSAHVGFWLGASPGVIHQFVGRMYEYVQYDRAINDFQLDQLNTYYSNKYGIEYNLL